MKEWIKNVPEIATGDATLASEAPVSDASRNEFWNAMATTPSDPFFDVTVSDSRVSIAASRQRVTT